MLERIQQFQYDVAQRGDALELLRSLPNGSAAAVIFDPQHRGVLNHLNFGNEGARQIGRAALPAMSDEYIDLCLYEAARVLMPSGYTFYWIDTFNLDLVRKRADERRLLQSWRAWHQEQLDQVLIGPHADVVAAVISVLEHLDMNSAGKLLACVQAVDWTAVDYATRLTVLHQINERVTCLREDSGLVGLDDPLPPKLNVFFTIKNRLFSPAKVGREGFHQSGR